MVPAVILAAGGGRRLGSLTEDRPKCLLPVGPQSLLEHQLDILRAHGIGRPLVVVGYRGETVEACVGRRAVCLDNPRHDVTNSLYSLWLAREHVQDGFFLLNGDVLFDPEIFRWLQESPYPDALAVERRRAFQPEEMKVELEGERIRAMSKELEAGRAHAENLGVVKISKAGARVLFDEMETLLAAGAEKEFVPYAFNAIAARYPLFAVPVDGLPWIEIDFTEDLERARREIWPAIVARPREAEEISLPAGNPFPVVGD